MRSKIPVSARVPMATRPAWFRAAVGACDAVTRRMPATGVRLAEAVGWLCHAGRLWGAAPSEVSAVFPWLPDAAAARLARRIAAQDLKCRAYDRLLYSGGIESAASLLSRPHLARLEQRLREPGGQVLLDVHTGPISATSAALLLLGKTALIVRKSGRTACARGLEVVGLEGDDQHRAQVLRRGVEYLRQGNAVVLAADGWEGAATEPVACCGRLVRFRRGAFVMARLSGAPILPLYFRWGDGGRIEVEAAEPIRPAGVGDAVRQETEMAAVVAGWLEGQLLARPDDLSLSLLKWLQTSGPPVAVL